MNFTGTFTTRGRITIPIELRRKLGWDGPLKVTVRDVGGKLLIKPIRRTKAVRKKS